MNDENKAIILNSALETQIKIKAFKDKIGNFFINHWREIAIIIIFIIMMGFMIYIFQNIEIMKTAPMDYCNKIFEENNCEVICVNYYSLIN